MSTLNQLVAEYTEQLKQGKLQAAYKGILDYLSRLRAEIAKSSPGFEVGSSVYQGYMDMSYFSLNTKALMEKGLKIAVVYLHEKRAFEIWLSARNRDISHKYRNLFNGSVTDGASLFHDNTNADAILEYTLTAEPDFDDQYVLTTVIREGTERFISLVSGMV